jgi:hypothetical protein
MTTHTFKITRFSRRRAALGIAAVLHLLWLSLIAVPAFASVAPVVGHCHEAAAISADAPDAPPCCEHQCHCVNGLCAAIPAVAGRVPPNRRIDAVSDISRTTPQDTAPDPQFRPPIHPDLPAA